MSSEFFTWMGDNIFKTERFSTVLLVIFLLIFMGILPSPMLTAIADNKLEHLGMGGVLRQICINGAKDQVAVNGCWYGPIAPGVLQQHSP